MVIDYISPLVCAPSQLLVFVMCVGCWWRAGDAAGTVEICRGSSSRLETVQHCLVPLHIKGHNTPRMQRRNYTRAFIPLFDQSSRFTRTLAHRHTQNPFLFIINRLPRAQIHQPFTMAHMYHKTKEDSESRSSTRNTNFSLISEGDTKLRMNELKDSNEQDGTNTNSCDTPQRSNYRPPTVEDVEIGRAHV